ncbi:scavenger receptor cysteine-rich type 1 protein M130-like, partial [Pungitius pungitius]|uniref:scavenger receptor cysteine-rich type 1 protein M130-like n=1 Tax=Pungitius pungitius TaxID=134920 RepID=UPI002E15BFE3
LVGGASRCEGTLEVKYQGEWRPVDYDEWNLKAAADSIRLVGGSGLCSGRLEVRSNQSNQWSSVCEEDFDQQGAEVVCRELGCGAPSVLQGALYGEVEAPMWTKGFQCGGHESALLDCRSSGSERNTCSPGKAVGLTCSVPLRFVGGASRCEGTLEVKYQGEWRPVDYDGMNLKEADVLCRDLDCGSAVSIRHREESSERSVWGIDSDCVQSGSALRECITSTYSSSIVDLTCSEITDVMTDFIASLKKNFAGRLDGLVLPTEVAVFARDPFTVAIEGDLSARAKDVVPSSDEGKFTLELVDMQSSTGYFHQTTTRWSLRKLSIDPYSKTLQVQNNHVTALPLDQAAQ